MAKHHFRLRPASPIRVVGQSRERCLAKPFGRRGRLKAGWRPKRVLRSERRARVRSGRRSSSARASGQRLDHPFGLSFRYLGRPKSYMLVRNVDCWAKPLLKSRSMRDPGFMNPIGASEPPDDSDRIVSGIFDLGFLLEQVCLGSPAPALSAELGSQRNTAPLARLLC